MGVRADKARDMFLQGYNCCQAVVGAFADLYGFDPETAMKFAEGFGGGLGRMRLTCGAVNAMAIVAGMKMSHGQPGDLKRRGEIYAVVRQMVEEFKANNGTVICAELLGLSMPKDTSPTPEERTPDYYKRRPCPDKIHECALLIEKYLEIEE
ncbi:MAG: C-GCAxxG-C-C family protein [Clostridiales bacterium]|nr:C-GCAxxG-C-C family protein [Clostridiales bacterium]